MFRALIIHCVTNDDDDHTITVLAADFLVDVNEKEHLRRDFETPFPKSSTRSSSPRSLFRFRTTSSCDLPRDRVPHLHAELPRDVSKGCRGDARYTLAMHTAEHTPIAKPPMKRELARLNGEPSRPRSKTNIQNEYPRILAAEGPKDRAGRPNLPCRTGNRSARTSGERRRRERVTVESRVDEELPLPASLRHRQNIRPIAIESVASQADRTMVADEEA